MPDKRARGSWSDFLGALLGFTLLGATLLGPPVVFGWLYGWGAGLSIVLIFVVVGVLSAINASPQPPRRPGYGRWDDYSDLPVGPGGAG